MDIAVLISYSLWNLQLVLLVLGVVHLAGPDYNPPLVGILSTNTNRRCIKTEPSGQIWTQSGGVFLLHVDGTNIK